MYTTLAPVVLFAYNRLQHTQNILASLEQNPLCTSSHLFVFCDAPSQKAKAADVAAVCSFLREYQTISQFQKVTLSIAASHKGLAGSVISGVSRVLRHYGKVIVLEDDLIVSKDFLQFMNDALDFYESDRRIWSISGHTPMLSVLSELPGDLYLAPRAGSWGWGTWVDRWNTIDWNVADYAVFERSLLWKYLFNRGGTDLSGMLRNQKEGMIDSWAVRWCYAQSRHNSYTVYPFLTKVQNCGLDGSGTNCRKRKSAGEMPPIEGPCRFSPLKPKRKIVQAFQRHYGPGDLMWLLSELKVDQLITLIKE